MYTAALDIGISSEEYWDMSLQEINDRIESFRRMYEFNRKNSISQDFVLAQAISSRVAFFFADEKDRDPESVLEPWDAYPDVFCAEKERVEDNRKSKELAEYKAQLQNFAARVNATFTRQGNGD